MNCIGYSAKGVHKTYISSTIAATIAIELRISADFGILLEFRAHWKDKYVVEVVENKLIIYSSRIPYGELFTIARTEEDLVEEDLLNFDFRSRILIKTDTYTYYQIIGSGYEGPWPKEEYPELYDEYIQMFKEGESVLNSIRAYIH